MLESILFVLIAACNPQDFSAITDAIAQREKELDSITAKVTRTVTSTGEQSTTDTFTVRKKGDFLAVEKADGTVYVFGPKNSFALQQTSDAKYIMVGNPVANLRPMKVDNWENLASMEAQLRAQYNRGRLPLTFVLPWTVVGVQNYDIEGPENVGKSPGHVVFKLRQKVATNDSDGKISSRYVFDSDHAFRPVSSLSTSENTDASHIQTWEFQDPQNYRYMNESNYKKQGWTSQEEYQVSISDATWKDSDFTMDYYSITAQQSSGIKPSWWLVSFGLFLIITVLAVKIRQGASHA